ncbi:type II secretion system F family protein [Kitasatospora sp. NPDC049285]|uniref:type II secretion system F family protein n=1 Tax=Kitasatospora sp. NPDC049285 TaxID=3157096 RepID=UPI00341C9B1F
MTEVWGRPYAVACAVTLLGVATGLGAGLFGTAWLAVVRRRARGSRRLRRVLDGTGGRGTGGMLARVRRRWQRRRPSWLVPELLLLPAGFAAGRWTGSAVPVLGAACAVVPLRRWRLRRSGARDARRRAAAVIDLCAGLAAELRSGATPEQALHAVLSRGAPDWHRRLGAEPAARLAAGRYGADIPGAFRLVAELPGGGGAAAMAACWQVSTESGTGLALGLEQVADALRAERALGEEIAGELAGPRTTVVVLAALPAVGMALGSALGAHPLHVLLHTPAGLLSLLAGALLEAAGIAWTARIVRGAEDAPTRPSATGRGVGGCGVSRVRGDPWLAAVPALTPQQAAVRAAAGSRVDWWR